MGRTWQWLAVVGLLSVAGCGQEQATDEVQGGEGVTVEAGTPAPEGAPAVDGAPAEVPPEIDIIPANE
jgi:hypothetical protein